MMFAKAATERPLANRRIADEEKAMKRLTTLMMLSLFSLGLTACHTVAGAGKDMQSAGEAVEETAQDCRDADC